MTQTAQLKTMHLTADEAAAIAQIRRLPKLRQGIAAKAMAIFICAAVDGFRAGGYRSEPDQSV